MLKVGVKVRMRRGKVDFVGVVIPADETPSGRLDDTRIKVRWPDGFECWEHEYNLEEVS